MVVAKNQQEFELALDDFGADIGSEVAEMLGGESFAGYDLPKLTVPGAGSTVWEMPETDDQPHAAEIEGVILHWSTTRAYHAAEYGDDDSTPDCISIDGMTGVGDPGGACESCRMNEWGSSRNGSGKACGERRMIYILRENSLVPMVVQVPAASLKAWRYYILAMLDRGGAKYTNTTCFALRAAKAGNRTYTQIVFRPGRRLTAEQTQRVREYATQIIAVVEGDPPI